MTLKKKLSDALKLLLLMVEDHYNDFKQSEEIVKQPMRLTQENIMTPINALRVLEIDDKRVDFKHDVALPLKKTDVN